MDRRIVAVLAIILFAVSPQTARAQLDKLDQAFTQLDKKLPPEAWDGKTLHVSTYEELQEVKPFILEYDRVTKEGKEALANLSEEERTDERRDKLNGYIDWMNELVAAFNEKYEELKPEKLEILTGPDAGKQTPYIIDTLGPVSTQVWVRSHPGPRKGSTRGPARYSILATFLVHYPDVSPEDIVLLQPMKGGKKLGPPEKCKPDLLGNYPLAVFNCDAGRNPDYGKLYSAPGDIEIKLTYRKVVEGKEHKNFETLHLRLVKQAQVNEPPHWGVDYDVELGPTIMQERENHQQSSGWDASAFGGIAVSRVRNPASPLVIYTMFKTGGSGPQPEGMTCLHEGKRVFVGEKGRRSGWSGKTESIKANRWDTITWKQVNFHLKYVAARPGPHSGSDTYFLNQHPGDYKCVITGDGEVLKEIYFEIDEHGDVVKPPCQAKSINTLRAITLLATKLKKPYDRKWDKKLAAKRGYSGGVTWAPGCPPTK